MIKDKKILINITTRNKNQYSDKYNIEELNKEYLIDIEDVNKNSKVKITAICDICETEKKISIQKILFLLRALLLFVNFSWTLSVEVITWWLDSDVRFAIKRLSVVKVR